MAEAARARQNEGVGGGGCAGTAAALPSSSVVFVPASASGDDIVEDKGLVAPVELGDASDSLGVHEARVCGGAGSQRECVRGGVLAGGWRVQQFSPEFSLSSRSLLGRQDFEPHATIPARAESRLVEPG